MLLLLAFAQWAGAQELDLGITASAIGLKYDRGDVAGAAASSGTPGFGTRFGAPDIPSSWLQAQDDKAGAADSPQRAWRSDPEPRKSYWIPALEIVGFDMLLNAFDRAYFGCCDYDTDLNSIKRNLRRKWVVENDPYAINQLGHPYQGSMYHGFARSAGLSYWESAAYTFMGSIFWEIAGETTRPSKNDQIASGIAGSFLGEALYRMSSLVLEKGGGLSRPYRELAAAAISPPTGFNRLAFGERFDTVFSSRDAAYYSRLAVGASTTTENRAGTSAEPKRTEGILDFSLDYGLPGNPDYAYRRPFDYFAFQASASTANGFENVMTRGLLWGRDYGGRTNYRGISGIYGSYDYIAPQIFRISSTAVSLGTTAEWRISSAMALQGSLLGGVGYAGVGTINGTRDRDYHYGLAPQALLALRLIFADRASLDLTAREYFVSDVATDTSGRGGHDNIARADAAITFRIHKQHAISLRYLWSRRDASYPVLGDRSQTRATIGIFYTLLGHDRFGAMDWK
ncbi:MAG TPA: DUF3943 domain-containing protein [Burkholderiales bacterium]|nr:DUF3943 domain-containing protein [Burkholderiales bacterium]